MTEEENWKDILGYEGFYQVSNLGRVRSVYRIVKGVFGSIQHKKSVILAPAMKTMFLTHPFCTKVKFKKISTSIETEPRQYPKNVWRVCCIRGTQVVS